MLNYMLNLKVTATPEYGPAPYFPIAKPRLRALDPAGGPVELWAKTLSGAALVRREFERWNAETS